MNACATWDFRMTAEDATPEQVITQLKSLCKKYSFQLEQGSETGYKHYQGRFSLIKKHRKNDLMKLFTIIKVPNYLEPTVEGVHIKGDLFYVLKDETRLEGPWDERDSNKYIPRQYQNLMDKLMPFQRQIFDSGEVFDTRSINLIFDTNGNNGKSTISVLCQLMGHGIDMPPVNDANLLVQSLCDICEAKKLRNPSPICLDLPRAMAKDRLYGLYTAIEQIKKGKLYDFRYSYKEWWIDSPQIWVFSNFLPDLDMLSADRWKIWIIDTDKKLVNYRPSELKEKKTPEKKF